MQRFRRLLGFVRPYAAALLLTFVAAVIASVLDGFTFALLISFFRHLFGTGSEMIGENLTGVEHAV